MLMNRTDGKEYVLSLSYGKDSLGCLGAICENLTGSIRRNLRK